MPTEELKGALPAPPEPLDPLKMSDEDFVNHCLENFLGGWVPLKQYLRLVPTESIHAVRNRLREGSWQRRVHYASPKGSGPWINLKAVRAWVEADGQGPGKPRSAP